MSSPAQDDVVDVTMQEAAEEEVGGEEAEEQEEAQEIVDVDGEEEEEKQEESEDDEVQFVGSVEGPNGYQEDAEKQTEDGDDVVVVENGEASPQGRSSANTNALMAAKGFVTPATLEAELQCIICQYAMFKPVSAICGHSFCRVCLMDSFLTRPIEEAQCPICRVEILQPFSAKTSLAPIFSINVTLWNLVQLLIPSVAERVASYQREEEEEFTRKLDQLDAKWKIFTLSERAARYHGDHDDEDGRTESARWEADHEGHHEYPVIKVEDTDDGNAHVSRNVVLDINDENEDGYINMRVGLAIVEFPSIFELYNEHQECSVNVIKMEEDEEMADGMPFFMNDDGGDDGFVCSSYYNEISLHVCDEAGNCVMERTRGAQGGVVTFPGLRLDAPGGVYTFRFADDLYGLKLSITTRLREPHEISDTPVADYVTLVQDEARDANRRGRGRHDSDEEGDYEEEGNESDDSFIVDDLNGEVHEEEPVGQFSDDEGHWQYQSDDEAADEEREQRRVGRRQRSGRRSDRDVQFVEEHQEEEEVFDDEGEHEDPGDGDEHEEEEDIEVRPGRRNVRVVEEAAFSSDGEAEEDAHETVEVADDREEGKGNGEEEEHLDDRKLTRPRRRNANQIVDSEDEDDAGPVESDEEQKGEYAIDGTHDEHAVNNDGDGAVNEEEDGDEEDGAVNPPSRKVTRSQWFQEEGSEEEEDNPPEPDAANLPNEEAKSPARRPRKRARGRDRQVRVVDEVESDEDQEEMERSIAAANSRHVHVQDENEDEDKDSSQFRRVHQFYDEEVEDHHEFDEEEVALDYPDEEDNYQEEQDDYASE